MLSVTELNQKAAELIQKNRRLQLLLTEGEIANLHIEENGTLFFTLRDEESSVKAVMFGNLAERLRFEPKDGLQVIAAGSADFYPPRGEFQLRVTDMLLQGLGTVQRGFQIKEQRLRKEALFQEEQKKAIPENPKKIGIITSATGAALQDILHVLEKNSPDAEKLLFPVHVQGKYAESEICQALETADTQNCDVLILGRGGGSAEDLSVFNSERIVRTVHACKTPVISAIGHQKDLTLTDKAADFRAATPTAAGMAVQKRSPVLLTEDNKTIYSVNDIHNGEYFRIILSDGVLLVRMERKEKNFMNENQNSRLKAYAERTEQILLNTVSAMQKQAEEKSLAIETLFDAMRHSLTAGGKRIRPALIYAFCEACGGTLEAADAAACAMEMTHTSSLIFDDLPAMDDDDLRRGKPSCHKAFGEATAILAGDALICAPFSVIAENKALTPEQKLDLIKILSCEEGSSGMVGGQMLDMQFETQETVTAKELEIMCLGKTGALMKASCQMGCICGNASAALTEAAGEYGLSVGLAFQIIDDILDVTATSEQLGKPAGSDAEEDKKTFVTVLGLENAQKRASALTAQAHAQLEKFPDSEAKAFLQALTDALLNRRQ